MTEQIVGLVLRPRRAMHIGALHASADPYAALAPDRVGRLVGRLGGRFLLRTGPPAATSDGGLFETVPAEAAVRGEWGISEQRRAKRAAAVAALIGLTGASAGLLSRARRA